MVASPAAEVGPLGQVIVVLFANKTLKFILTKRCRIPYLHVLERLDSGLLPPLPRRRPRLITLLLFPFLLLFSLDIGWTQFACHTKKNGENSGSSTLTFSSFSSFFSSFFLAGSSLMGTPESYVMSRILSFKQFQIVFGSFLRGNPNVFHFECSESVELFLCSVPLASTSGLVVLQQSPESSPSSTPGHGLTRRLSTTRNSAKKRVFMLRLICIQISLLQIDTSWEI